MASIKSRTSFRPKACLRCGGDAYLNRDDGADWVCLQCGRSVAEPAGVVKLGTMAATRPEAVAAGSRAA